MQAVKCAWLGALELGLRQSAPEVLCALVIGVNFTLFYKWFSSTLGSLSLVSHGLSYLKQYYAFSVYCCILKNFEDKKAHDEARDEEPNEDEGKVSRFEQFQGVSTYLLAER